MTVLFAHSVAVLGLPPERDFFFKRLGFSLGEMGLDMLFVTSGFLVTASLFVRQDLIAFLWARILRVFPGMWVMLVLTVFVLAPALTTLPREDYYASPLTWEYFRKCATLVRRRALFAAGRVRDRAAQRRVQRLAVDDAGRSADVPLSGRHLVALAFVPALRLKAMRVVLPLSAAVLFAIVLSARLTGGAYNGRTFASSCSCTDRASSFGGTGYRSVLACSSGFSRRLSWPRSTRRSSLSSMRPASRLWSFIWSMCPAAASGASTLGATIPTASISTLSPSSRRLPFSSRDVARGDGGIVGGGLGRARDLSWKLIEKRAMGLKDDFAEATSRVLISAWRRSPPSCADRSRAWFGALSGSGADRAISGR